MSSFQNALLHEQTDQKDKELQGYQQMPSPIEKVYKNKYWLENI